MTNILFASWYFLIFLRLASSDKLSSATLFKESTLKLDSLDLNPVLHGFR